MTEKIKEAYRISAAELAALGIDKLPEELQSSKHLIYSSPATLAFNSPGAQGFGVKRAGLAVPGSVMLLVAPACCGRNTTMLSELGGYADRFYYLLQDETDIVTGRHLSRIPQAVKEVVDSREEKPSCVMICITCVDALLGTDMDRVCKKCSEHAGVPVLPCYMYALTREGRVPPMTAVRKTVYDLLEKSKRNPKAVNLIGQFAPYEDGTELYELLRSLGLEEIREISRCESFDEYKKMAEANFNLVLNPESRLAAEDMAKRLELPYIELKRQYRIDKIHRQYELLGGALGVKIDDGKYYEDCKKAVDAFAKKHAGKKLAIGESINADPFELALAFAEMGLEVCEIYGTVSAENFFYIKKLAEKSPETEIFTNLEPSMLFYDCSESDLDFTLGKDAEYYNPDAPNVAWNVEVQPFGYDGLKTLLERIEEVI